MFIFSGLQWICHHEWYSVGFLNERVCCKVQESECDLTLHLNYVIGIQVFHSWHLTPPVDCSCCCCQRVYVFSPVGLFVCSLARYSKKCVIRFQLCLLEL